MLKSMWVYIIFILLLVLPIVQATPITGEPFKGVCQVIMFDAGGTRGYTVSIDDVDPLVNQGNQSTWQGRAGNSFTLRFEWATTGGPLFGQATTATVNVRVPSGSNVGSTWNPTITGDNGVETRTFHFDDDPLNQAFGTNRSGMLELYLQVQRTTVATWGPIDCRDSVTSPPATTTINTARGYLRANMTMTSSSKSNVTYGGATPSLWAFPDSVFPRLVTDAITYESMTLCSGVRNVADTGIERNTCNTGTAVTRDVTSWSGNSTGNTNRINKDFNGRTNRKSTLTISTSTSFGGELRYVFDSSTLLSGYTLVDPQRQDKANDFDVDGRVNATQIMQANDNIFGTPPTSKDIVSGLRLNSDLGFVATRWINARGDGVPNLWLNWTEALYDFKQLTGTPASPTKSRGANATTQGGQAGWSDQFLTWDSSLPSGVWVHNSTITTTDMTGAGLNGTRNLTLISPDPRVQLIGGAGKTLADLNGTHFMLGENLLMGSALAQDNVKTSFMADSAKVSIIRFNQTLGTTEFLNSSYQWQTGDTVYQFTMSPSLGDSKLALFIIDGANTSTWTGTDRLFFLFTMKTTEGTPYFGDAELEIVYPYNKHNRETAGDPLMQLDCSDKVQANEIVYCSFTSQNLNGTTRNDLTFNYEVLTSGGVTAFSGTATNTNSRGKYRFSFTPTSSDTYEVTIFNDTETLAMTTKVQVIQRGGLSTEQNSTLYSIKTDTTNIYTYLTGTIKTELDDIQSTVNDIDSYLTGFVTTQLNNIYTFVTNVWLGWTAQSLHDDLHNEIESVNNTVKNLNGTINITANVNSTEIRHAVWNDTDIYPPYSKGYMQNKTYTFRGVSNDGIF